MLFQWEVGGHAPEHVVSTFLQAQKVEPDVASFARTLFEGTVQEIERLDGLVREHSEHWRPERMAAVDRSILRVALYEMLHHPETPVAVVINEALEIARRFSGADSVQFVNGILDAVRKKLSLAKAQSHNPGPPFVSG
jgi:N utilization substance protein B